MIKHNKYNLNTKIQRFWEQRLTFEFDIEQIRYKKLCEKLTKKETKILNGTYFFTTYAEWKEYINKSIKILNKDELTEYRRFLISKSRNSISGNKLFYNALLPIISSTMVSLVINIFASVYKGVLDILKNIILFPFILFSLAVFLYILSYSTRNQESDKNFYEDILEIVDDHLK